MHPELIPGWPIHSYGLMLVIAFYSAYFLSRWTARREGVDPERMIDLLLIGALLGIAGARALYVIQDPGHISGLIDLIAIWRGGLVFYGGLIAATAGLIIYIRAKKLPLWRLADAAAAAVMLGLAFGRIGCFLNGCCWGAVCDEKYPLAVRYPQFVSAIRQGRSLSEIVTADGRWKAVETSTGPDGLASEVVSHKRLEQRIKEDPEAWRSMDLLWVRRTHLPDGAIKHEQITGSPAYLQHLKQRPDRLDPNIATRSLPVHPTQLYESGSALALCGILLLWWRWRRRPGEVFALMGCLYSVVRFTIEGFRNDTSPVLGSLTLGQVTSIPVFAVGLAAFVYCRMSGAKYVSDARLDNGARRN